MENQNKEQINNEIENNEINQIENNDEINQIENNDEVKKLIEDLNISVETYHNFFENEFKKYKKEQTETINNLDQKINELNKLLEPEWQTEEKNPEIKSEESKNYNAFWKGE